MVEVRVETSEVESRIKTLNLEGIIKRSAKRAATHAKKIGSQRVRARYTIRSFKGGIKPIRATGDGAEILFQSPRLPVERYKARVTSKGIFVSIKRGQGAIVPRSFVHPLSGRFMQREGKPRYPIHSITSLSIPQLFGNETVLEQMSEAALMMFEKRVEHEIERVL